MKMAWVAMVLGLMLALVCGVALAQNDADNPPEEGDDTTQGAAFVDGRVKEIDLKIAKVAVEVTPTSDKPAEIMIFTLSAETLVRKNDKALKVIDVHKGNPVRVYYTPIDKKGESGKALLIEIVETRAGGIGRGGRGRGGVVRAVRARVTPNY